MSNRDKAYINRGALKWAMERIHITPKYLAVRTKLPEDRIQSWLDGHSVPSFSQARKICGFFGVSISTLYLDDEYLYGSQKSIEARKVIDSKPDFSVEARIKIMEFITRASHYYSLARSRGIRHVPGKMPIDKRDFILNEMRSLSGIRSTVGKYADKRKVFDGIRTALFVNGVVVLQMKDVDISELRGFLTMEESYAAIIVNNNDTFAGKIFTIMHELAHLLTGIGRRLDGSPDVDESHALTDEEREIENFAGHALATDTEAIAHYMSVFKRGLSVSDNCNTACRKLLLSPVSLAYRLLRNGIINQGDFTKVKDEFVQKAKAEANSRNLKEIIVPEENKAIGVNGRRYALEIASAHGDGVLSITEAMSALSVSYNTFRKIEAVI